MYASPQGAGRGGQFQVHCYPNCKRPRRPCVGGRMTDELRRTFPHAFRFSAAAARPDPEGAPPGGGSGKANGIVRPHFSLSVIAPPGQTRWWREGVYSLSCWNIAWIASDETIYRHLDSGSAACRRCRASGRPRPRPETAVVFAEGKDGYPSIRIPALLTTRRGTLLALRRRPCRACRPGGQPDHLETQRRRRPNLGAVASRRSRRRQFTQQPLRRAGAIDGPDPVHVPVLSGRRQGVSGHGFAPAWKDR